MADTQALFDEVAGKLVLPTLRNYYILGAQQIRRRDFPNRREYTFWAKRRKQRCAVVIERSGTVVMVTAKICRGRGQRRLLLGAVFGSIKTDDWEVYAEWLRNQFIKYWGWRIAYDAARGRMVYSPPMQKF